VQEPRRRAAAWNNLCVNETKGGEWRRTRNDILRWTATTLLSSSVLRSARSANPFSSGPCFFHWVTLKEQCHVYLRAIRVHRGPEQEDRRPGRQYALRRLVLGDLRLGRPADHPAGCPVHLPRPATRRIPREGCGLLPEGQGQAA